MSEERIDIEVQDKVSPSIRDKMLGIADASEKADRGVTKLKKALAGLNDGAISKLSQALNSNASAVMKQAQAQSALETATKKSALASQKLATEQARTAAETAKASSATQKFATEQQRTAAATMQAEAALAKAVAAEQRLAAGANNAAIGSAKLAAEQAKLSAATLQAEAALNKAVAEETNAATAAARLAAAQHGVGAAMQQAAAATSNAAAAQTRAATAQTTGATAAQRLATAQQQTAGATQRVATEMQRTATATAQAAAAKDRAALAALRLAQAQGRAARGSKTLGESLLVLTRSALGFAGVYLGAKGFIDLADGVTTLNNSLVNVAKNQAGVEKLKDSLFDVAMKTRLPIAETTESFVRFDNALKRLGSSQAETIRFTEIMAKGIQSSGKAGTAGAAGLYQFSQALSKGKLDGDEFRSVMENIPFLADLIAKEMGKPVQALNKLSEEGKITSEVLRKTILNAADEIEYKFNKLSPTIAGALTNLSTAFTRIADSNNNGAFVAVANSILFIADNLERLAVYAGTAAAAFGGAYVVGMIAAAVATGGLSGALALLRLALLRTGIGVLIVLVGEAIYQFAKLAEQVGGMGPAFTVIGGTGKAALDWIIAGGMSMIDAFVGITLSIGAAFTALWASVQAGFAALMVALQAGVNTLISGLNSAFTFDIKNPFTGEILTSMQGLGIGAANFADMYTKAANDSAASAEDLAKRTSAAFDSMRNRFTGLESPVTAFERLKNEAVAAKTATDAAKKSTDDALRGATKVPTYVDDGGKGAKAAEKRAGSLAKINRELDSQLENLRLIGPAQEIANKMSEIENSLATKKISLSAQERAAILSKLQTIEMEKGVNRELNSIYDETTGKIVALANASEALSRAYSMGMLGAEQYGIRLAQLGIEAANLRLQMGDGTWSDMLLASIGRVTEGYQGLLPGLTSSFGDFFSSLTDGFANSIGRAIVYGENLGDALRDVARSALSELIGALVKLGIQYVIMNTIGQGLATAATATTALQATAAAASWAPAAALASLATLGANAAPAAAAVTGTMALTQGLAATSVLGGFQQGGYTGNMGVGDVAGVVHGQEYVMDARSTAAIGVDNLDALRANAGRSKSSASGSVGMGTQLNVTFENYGTSKDIEVQQLSENDVRVIARDVAKKTVQDEAPGVVAADLGNPNGRVSKAVTQNTTASRKR